MDSTLKGGPSLPPMSEESADSELWASDAAMLSCGGEEEEEEEEEEEDDDDAESCNCNAYGCARRGYDSCDEDGGGGGDEEAGVDGSPVSWWTWLSQNAACGGEKVGRGEEEEIASVKPVAETEDRLFWETCLAYGYP